jgi:hypothetical protein
MVSSASIKRINQPLYKKELKKFYKTIMNSQQPNRGRDMVIISIKTFKKITDVINRLQVEDGPKYVYLPVAHYLEYICLGNRYSNSKITVKRHVLSSYLQRAVDRMGIDVKPRKITLNSLYTSGEMIRISYVVGFDLEYECKLYGIPYI